MNHLKQITKVFKNVTRSVDRHGTITQQEMYTVDPDNLNGGAEWMELCICMTNTADNKRVLCYTYMVPDDHDISQSCYPAGTKKELQSSLRILHKQFCK